MGVDLGKSTHRQIVKQVSSVTLPCQSFIALSGETQLRGSQFDDVLEFLESKRQTSLRNHPFTEERRADGLNERGVHSSLVSLIFRRLLSNLSGKNILEAHARPMLKWQKRIRHGGTLGLTSIFDARSSVLAGKQAHDFLFSDL